MFQQDEVDIQRAMRLHQQGRLPEAEAVYRSVLGRAPNHPEALHMLGLLAFQAGQSAVAADLVERSLALVPNNPIACSNLAEIRRTLGQFDAAVALCQRALSLHPNLSSAFANLAAVYRQTGNLDNALAAARRVIELTPDSATGYATAGAVLLDQNNLSEALKLLEHSTRLAPNNASFASNLGLCYTRLTDFPKAIATHRHAISLEPNNPTIAMNYAIALAESGDHADAAVIFQKIIDSQPNNVDAIQNLASAQCDLHHHIDALRLARRALDLNPKRIETLITLGNIHTALGQFDDALRSLHQALAIQPSSKIYCALASALAYSGNPQDALAAIDQALAAEPSHAFTRFDRSFILLLLGRLEEAWPDYEWRWKHPKIRNSVPHFDVPQWRGEPLAGKKVLLHAEQGFGDAIHFIRYAPLVAQRGGTVIVRCQPELKRLLAGMPGIHQIIADTETSPPFDLHCPLLSLPLVFRTTLESIPAQTPYLHADPATAARWREKLATPGKKLKVGISWAGRPTHATDFLRSIPPATFADLLRVNGVTFYNLQKDASPATAKPLLDAGMIDLTPDLHDFADTAALLENLDLLISVDTALVHLAGALAKPAWVLLPFSPDWRWMLNRTDTPWYPSLRLFRQPQFADWPAVIKKIRTELQKLTS